MPEAERRPVRPVRSSTDFDRRSELGTRTISSARSASGWGPGCRRRAFQRAYATVTTRSPGLDSSSLRGDDSTRRSAPSPGGPAAPPAMPDRPDRATCVRLLPAQVDVAIAAGDLERPAEPSTGSTRSPRTTSARCSRRGRFRPGASCSWARTSPPRLRPCPVDRADPPSDRSAVRGRTRPAALCRSPRRRGRSHRRTMRSPAARPASERLAPPGPPVGRRASR